MAAMDFPPQQLLECNTLLLSVESLGSSSRRGNCLSKSRNRKSGDIIHFGSLNFPSMALLHSCVRRYPETDTRLRFTERSNTARSLNSITLPCYFHPHYVMRNKRRSAGFKIENLRPRPSLLETAMRRRRSRASSANSTP